VALGHLIGEAARSWLWPKEHTMRRSFSFAVIALTLCLALPGLHASENTPTASPLSLPISGNPLCLSPATPCFRSGMHPSARRPSIRSTRCILNRRWKKPCDGNKQTCNAFASWPTNRLFPTPLKRLNALARICVVSPRFSWTSTARIPHRSYRSSAERCCPGWWAIRRRCLSTAACFPA